MTRRRYRAAGLIPYGALTPCPYAGCTFPATAANPSGHHWHSLAEGNPAYPCTSNPRTDHDLEDSGGSRCYRKAAS